MSLHLYGGDGAKGILSSFCGSALKTGFGVALFSYHPSAGPVRG